MTGQKTFAMVLDVESVGLHGEGFAYGLVVVDLITGQELDRDLAWCNPNLVRSCRSGPDAARAWIKTHVMPGLQTDQKHWPTHLNPWDVRDSFWKKWTQWRESAQLWADCGWPVEAKFLAKCVKDDPVNRAWSGPYPLQEIATVIQLAGGDPLADYARLPGELPKHHPLADARQSARLLSEAMQKIGAST